MEGPCAASAAGCEYGLPAGCHVPLLVRHASCNMRILCEMICAKTLPAGTLHSASGKVSKIRILVHPSNRWAGGAGYNNKRTGQGCYQASKARRLSRSQSDTWIMALCFFSLCSQDCGLAAPSMSGSADPVRITDLLMCFEHTLQR